MDHMIWPNDMGDMIASYRLYDMSHSVIYTVYMKVPTVSRNSKN